MRKRAAYRRLGFSVLAFGTFVLAYAAGVYSCARTLRRRVERIAPRPRGLPDLPTERPRLRAEPASQEVVEWARQAMFGR